MKQTSQILQTGTCIPEQSNYIPSTTSNVLWGRLPCRNDRMIGTVHSGNEITIDTISHEGLLEDQGSDPMAYFTTHGVAANDVLNDGIAIARECHRNPDTDGPHVVTGPIAVPEAHPGDLLAITPTTLVPRVPYGVISTRHARGVLAGSEDFDGNYGQFCRADVESETAWFPVQAPYSANTSSEPASTVRFPMRPFLGIMGVTTASGQRPSSIPPADYGGNIDLRNLTVGSTLFLPVQIEGAGLYIGDPHFAQGNGEVSLTALEASLRATLRVQVVPADEAKRLFGRTDLPFAISHGTLVPMGFGSTLDDALSQSVEHAIDMIATMFEMPRQQVYLLLSAAVDFDVTQAVDITKSVHGLIDLSMFQQLPAYERTMRDIKTYADDASQTNPTH